MTKITYSHHKHHFPSRYIYFSYLEPNCPCMSDRFHYCYMLRIRLGMGHILGVSCRHNIRLGNCLGICRPKRNVRSDKWCTEILKSHYMLNRIDDKKRSCKDKLNIMNFPNSWITFFFNLFWFMIIPKVLQKFYIGTNLLISFNENTRNWRRLSIK